MVMTVVAWLCVNLDPIPYMIKMCAPLNGCRTRQPVLHAFRMTSLEYSGGQYNTQVLLFVAGLVN